MMLRANTTGRKRPANVRRRKPKGLLEVSVRAETAIRQRNRRFMRWTCILVLTAATVVGAWQGAHLALNKLFWNNPDYRLGTLSVSTDGILSREEIVDAAKIHEGENIFRLNLAQAREGIAHIPQVESVEVQRVLPSRVNIRVVERRPVAWVTSQYTDDPAAGHAFLTDASGVLMVPHHDASAHYRLPVIHGMAMDDVQPGDTVSTEGMKAALDLLRLNADNPRFQIRGIDVSKSYCVTITDRNHAGATFGFDDLTGQLGRLNRLLDYCDQNRREIQAVNLMVKRNMPVVFAPLDGGPAEGAAPPHESTPRTSPATDPAQVEKAKGATHTVRRAEPLKKTKPKPKPKPTPPVVRRALPVSAGH
jgi:cell division septal protein FtsQ